ncbi:Eco57I restriction-modification methylase domain-containing protein [Novosphingobium sp. CECT 9465]|uniref:Eco57I restriction-modification methylase domain-containing protein n=2 Tax=Novosphingobium sp. CECT 9465 TaxID=2829794 RepID=UPI001E5B716D|nr:Eco57I restriction-modification methylase domain-containing protein [Novosphingobium sp. CECT 9465]CAH0498832.1 hypothetical protein NVSP9465_03926 [Novosphingobium sp. CECT 9465]
MVEGFEDSTGQFSLWRLYSFRDLPVELISNIYQLFVKDAASSIYTPPALVRLMLEETLSWDRIDRLMAGDGSSSIRPADRASSWSRHTSGWCCTGAGATAGRVRMSTICVRCSSACMGVDLEEGAVELAAFSLCLSLCDALQPEEIRSSVKLFPRLADNTLHWSCFFEAKERGLVQAPVAVVVGNPPFESALTTDGARRSYAAYTKAHGALADNQLAYLFLSEAMELLSPGGVLAMVEPAGFLYNQHALTFRQSFFSRWSVREVLDFVSVRGLFKKGEADPKVVVVIAEAVQPTADSRLLHAVFRRNGRATAEQGFDIDYYDLHWFGNAIAEKSRDIWRANLLGGSRVHDLIQRLRDYPTLRDFAQKHQWDFGEGYIAGRKGISRPAEHLVGKPLLPTSNLSRDGLDTRFLDVVPDKPIKDTKTARRFTPPLLLIKEHEDLHHGVWNGHYLAYKHEIVGLAAPAEQLGALSAINDWLFREATVLRAYVAGISARLFTQRATAILSADVLAVPYPEDHDLDLSENERIVAADVVEHQREFIRLGTGAAVMRPAPGEALAEFDDVFARQINAVYPRTALKALPGQRWPGAICKAYVFGDGEVDWTGADGLRQKLDALLQERRGTSLTITRITRLYDDGFVFLLKPDRHRFWTPPSRFGTPTTCSPTSERRASEVLADEGERGRPAGALSVGIHQPGEWLSALVGFIGGALAGWRDDPAREAATGETKLTAQLCSRLNSLSRHAPGWDFIQFKREEPDEADGRRAIDLAVAPSGAIIWIEGREYTEYRTLLPIECKRLPTPAAADRDEREYLISRFSSTGGIQRFKAGHHGGSHRRAAMIGYVQVNDIPHWKQQLDSWVDAIVGDTVENWSVTDKLALLGHDAAQRLAFLRSHHQRLAGLSPIQIDHLWIEM